MRPRSALQNAQIGEELSQSFRCHCRSAVGVPEEPCGINTLVDERLSEHFLGKKRAFASLATPCDYLPAENIENDVEMIVKPLLWPGQLWVSSAGESHSRALAEPDVSLSAHPAPITEPPL
jgi:hypothetical protein